MRKIRWFLMLFILMIPISVKADRMYRVDMNIDILKDGSANITETWDVKADGGTEWYKQLLNLENSEISNYVVYMDGRRLKSKVWDVDDSLAEKAGYYGINRISDGIELCFGKSDMKRHTFTLNYQISNYVFNTSDSQVLYWTLLPEATVDNFSVNVTSYYAFPDTLDVWGYGYKGYAYVADGKISMSNEGSLNGDYVVLLVKFPSGTFNTSNKKENYNSFNDVYEVADNGSYEHNYDDDSENIMDYVSIFIFLGSFLSLMGTVIGMGVSNSGYGYLGNKKIDKKNVSMYRDIPCNKDIYYANILVKLNNFGYSKSNILGAIILKWVKEDKIGFRNEKTGIFNKDTSVIDLTKNPDFDNTIEKFLFVMMKEASKDGLLEAKEFEKWCRRNYDEFLDIIDRIENDALNTLKSNAHIYHRITKKDCKYKNVMDDQIYNDSVQLYGLKKYLLEFSKIDTKEVMEVKLWDEYLMFAYLFGIADKVAKQLKNMYPEVLQQNNFDYDTIVFVNTISARSVSAASGARSAAESYSSGGGGFSSGGGGGGSFGGGGSMGGR